MAPGQIATPQRCVPGRSLGTQIGLGRGRQNERDLVMVEDPLIDFEEVVVGMRSLGSNPMAHRDISSGSSRLRSLSKLRARWGLIPIEPTSAHTGVRPAGPPPQRDHWCRSLRGTNGACGNPTGGCPGGPYSRIPAAGVSTPCRLNKTQQSKLSNQSV